MFFVVCKIVTKKKNIVMKVYNVKLYYVVKV